MARYFDPPPRDLSFPEDFESGWWRQRSRFTPPYECYMHLKYETIGSRQFQTPGVGDLYMFAPDRPASHGGRIDASSDLDLWGWRVCGPDEEVVNIGPMPPLMSPHFGVPMPYPYTEGPGGELHLFANGYRWLPAGGGWSSAPGLGVEYQFIVLTYFEVDDTANPYDWRWIMEFCPASVANDNTVNPDVVALNKMWRLTVEYEPVANPRKWKMPELPTKLSARQDERVHTGPLRRVSVPDSQSGYVGQNAREERNRVEGLTISTEPAHPPFYTREMYEAGVPRLGLGDDSMASGFPIGENRVAVFSRHPVFVKGSGVQDSRFRTSPPLSSWQFQQGETEIVADTAPDRYGPVDYRWESGIAVFDIVENPPFGAVPKIVDYKFVTNGDWSTNSGDMTLLGYDPVKGHRVMTMEMMEGREDPDDDYELRWACTVADIDPSGKINILHRGRPAATGVYWNHEAIVDVGRTHPIWEDGLFSDYQWHDCGIVGVSRNAAFGIWSDPVNGVRGRALWVNEDGTFDRGPIYTLDEDINVHPVKQVYPWSDGQLEVTWLEYHGQARQSERLPDGRILLVLKGADSRGVARIAELDDVNRTVRLGPQSTIAESWYHFDEFLRPAGYPEPPGLYTVENIQLTGFDGTFSLVVHNDKFFSVVSAAGDYTARRPSARLYQINDDETITMVDYSCDITNPQPGAIRLTDTKMLVYDYTFGVGGYDLRYDPRPIVVGATYIYEIDVATGKYERVYGLGPMQDLPYGWSSMCEVNENMGFVMDLQVVCDLRKRYPLTLPVLTEDGYGYKFYEDFDVTWRGTTASGQETHIRRPGKPDRRR